MQDYQMERKDVDIELTWDPTGIYADEADFLADVRRAEQTADEIEKNYKGCLRSAKAINDCLDKLKIVYEIFDIANVYTGLFVEVDRNDEAAQEQFDAYEMKKTDILTRLSFIESEIIENEESVIMEAVNASLENAGFLKEILRNKKHRLSVEAERVLKSLSGVFEAPYNIYHKAKINDMKFPDFELNGKKYPMSLVLMDKKWERTTDTELRRAASKAFFKTLAEYQNTLAANYQSRVQCEKVMATLRGFDSVFDYLLFEQKISREMYEQQLDIIMKELAPHMRKYAQLLKRVHGMDKITFADLKLELDPSYMSELSIAEAKDIILDGLSVMGEDYLGFLRDEFDERRIDFARNKGKSSDSFCDTPYRKPAYILVSWTGSMRDAIILAHELGHAAHFHMAAINNNIFDVEPSLYFIEAPSTIHEVILTNSLLSKKKDPRFKRWLLSTMINRTYYHNFVTHFIEAVYQREVYRLIDKGESINATKLNNIQRKALEDFWGDDVEIGEGAELTWMRQPHYFSGLYSYTYSAGLTIATEAGLKIVREGEPMAKKWKEVLSAGGTKSPVELAEMAGMDITTGQPLKNTISHIGSIVDELVSLTDILEAQ